MSNFHFDMKYRLLEPIGNKEDYSLSIGTITMLIPEKINFDFFITIGNTYVEDDGTVLIEASAEDLSEETYADEYKALNLNVREMDKSFFESRKQFLRVLEVYTELYHCDTEKCTPLELLSIELVFGDGSEIDLTKRITAQCQEILKECVA